MWVRLRVSASLRLALASVAVAAPAVADDDGAAAPDHGAPSGTGASVAAEPVYVNGERRRDDGPVRASVADEDLARWNVGGNSDPRFPSNRPGFHVAPRVVVDVLLRPGRLPLHATGRGVLSETAVLAQARNHGYWPFRLCYEQGLRKDQKLKGETRVHAVLDGAGRVRGGHVVKSELGDREVARCLAAHAEQLHFTPPPAGRLGVDFVVALSPGDAKVPLLGLEDAAASDTPRPRSAVPTGVVDTRRLGELLNGALGPAGTCYAAARTADPNLWGRLGLRVDVDRHGNVTVREHESHFPSPDVVACARAAVGALPLTSAAPAPSTFTWGLRFGSPLPPAPAPARAVVGSTAEIAPQTTVAQTKVAESPGPLVPLVP